MPGDVPVRVFRGLRPAAWGVGLLSPAGDGVGGEGSKAWCGGALVGCDIWGRKGWGKGLRKRVSG